MKLYLLLLTLLASSTLLKALTASAELSECNGVWTNKPCAGSTSQKMAETNPTPRPQGEVEASRKKFLISDLETRRVSVRNQYGVDLAISSERELCLSPSTSLVDCSKAVESKQRYLEEKGLEAAKLKAQQASSSSSRSDDPTNVTIINRTEQIIVPPRDRRPPFGHHFDDHHDKPRKPSRDEGTPKPIETPKRSSSRSGFKSF